MALVTWLGVNVVVISLTWLLGPLLGAWPLIPQALFVNALVVVLLTWVIMPLLTRLFRRWLYPPEPGLLAASTKEEPS
jgi:antibiotic biosynthesis monooxygenase (ABM) superfamily enzyme